MAALVWRANALLEAAGDGSGPRGGGGDRVEFFTLPSGPAMTAVDVPPPPRVDISDIPPIDPIPLELTRLDVPLAASVVSRGAPGPGSGGGSGGGAAPGTGTVTGAGTGEEDGYFPPDPRGAILPPVEGVPSAVRKRPHRVTWWVAADGRIERVEVNPAIQDEKYRREFLARMRSFTFEPARTRDGRRVPGVVTITVTP